jgi:hypothetical protein
MGDPHSRHDQLEGTACKHSIGEIAAAYTAVLCSLLSRWSSDGPLMCKVC